MALGARGVILIGLLLRVVSVDAARGGHSRYSGVSKRVDGFGWYCEVHFVGSANKDAGHKRVKFYASYRTEELAALACDVVHYYTRSPGSFEFNLAWSEDVFVSKCPARSVYETLHTWEDRRRFVRRETDVLISFLTYSDEEDVEVPPSARRGPDILWEDLLPVTLQRSVGELAREIVVYFRNQLERLRRFLRWLLSPSNEQRILREVLSQKTSQQQKQAHKSPFYMDEAFNPDLGDLNGIARDVAVRVESLKNRPGRNLLMALSIGCLPFIFTAFESISNGDDIDENGVWREDGARSFNDEQDRVWSKLQELKKIYLEDMLELYGLLSARSAQPMCASDLQKCKYFKDVMNRMIPYLRVPRERVPVEFNSDKADAFEKQLQDIMHSFKRRKGPA